MKTDEEIKQMFEDFFGEYAFLYNEIDFFSAGVRSVEMEYFNRLKEMEKENHQLRESMRII